MSTTGEILPIISPEVTISPIDPNGRRVVKHPRKQKYLQIGQEESFLLSQFDGKTSFDSVIASFTDRFGDSITRQELTEFVALAKREGLLTTLSRSSGGDRERKSPVPFLRRCVQQARKQSPLYFRISVFNPDRSLNWLEPKTRWVFSPSTALAAAILGAAAVFIAWTNWPQLTGQFASLLGWKTFVIAWATIIAATICHEYGHGLACKRYGGDVREMGILWIFFMPCFYCNVSDAWLVPSRWKRLLISMAGTYVDFLIWIVAVFVWRVAAPGTWLSVATLMIIVTCGVRVAFNLNPLMRMDGYYALSDLTGVHNLRRRARAHLMSYCRWILWAAPRPKPVDDGGVLLAYGIVSWLFVVGFMTLLTFRLSSFLQPLMGIGGVLVAGSFFCVIAKRYFQGSLGEDFRIMLRAKKWRVLLGVAMVVGVSLIPITDRAGGEFYVRPMIHAEVRAPVAGFLREVRAEQGAEVSSTAVIARIEVPELTSQIARKQLEISETEAVLRKLRCGPRPEIMLEQKERVARASEWRDLAKQDLKKADQRLLAEFAAFESRLDKAKTELRYRTTIWKQARQLHDKGGLAGQQLLLLERELDESRSALRQVEAEKDARAAEGVLVFQAELARREKELADTISEMTLLEAGTRPEEIEAEEAKLRRLKEEVKHLLELEEQQLVVCPVSGTVTTARLKEKVGQYLQLGDIICVVEDLSVMEAELKVSEHDAYILQPGQRVTLRPRSLPFSQIVGEVERIAPATLSASLGTVLAGVALPSTGKANLAVYCRVDNAEGTLRTGMTGFGRVHANKKSLGAYALNKAVRLMRTEFWW